MPADQAAGLRRRSALHLPRCIHCCFDSASSISRLAAALHRHGWASLLVDMHGRLDADSPTRSLFDWRQQIARGQLQLQAMPYGDVWHAPGVRADEPALRRAAHGYDLVLFDGAPGGTELFLMSDAAHALIVEVQPTHESMLRAYTLLKSLSHVGGAYGVGLLGDAAACDQVMSACGHFLDPGFGQAIFSVAHEDDAFARLAVRMAGEEASRNGSLQHRETLNGW
jgi:hypothetical protein